MVFFFIKFNGLKNGLHLIPRIFALNTPNYDRFALDTPNYALNTPNRITDM